MRRELHIERTQLDLLYPLLTSYQLKTLALEFVSELAKALKGKQSSLPMILNPVQKIQPDQGYGVAVSVGGTNGYVSAFRIARNGTVKFLNRVSFMLPEDTQMETLFHLLTQNVRKVTKGRKRPFPIGIGFAYPLKPLLVYTYIDGELLFMSKGRTIEGLVGKKVGQEYHRFLIREYGIDTTVTVSNDAICLLMGGDGALVAGVVGTGLNFAYWEKTKHIASTKLSALAGFAREEIAINIESKNFNKIPSTVLRTLIDKKSDDPGYSLSEKETAGAYLYQIFNAGKDRIIGKNFPSISSTDQLNEILTHAFMYPAGLSKEEREKAYNFAERIFHRSAQIVTIQLCGILLKIDKTRGVIPIVMEGGIFWKAKNYASLVNLYMNTILPEVIPSFARLFGSSRRGVAFLAMHGQE